MRGLAEMSRTEKGLLVDRETGGGGGAGKASQKKETGKYVRGVEIWWAQKIPGKKKWMER